MRIYEGSPRQDYEEVLRSIGAFVDQRGLHEILLAARRSIDAAERTELYRRAQALVFHDAPWAPLVHATQTAAVRRGVTGFDLHPTGSKWLQPVRVAAL